ncbi:ankyrin repeat-containing domain protein [Aspergillus recurvatus]
MSWRRTRKGYADIVRSILQLAGINPNTSCQDGCTPLCLAAKYGHEETVAALLQDPRTDPNVQDTVYDQSPLLWAVEEGNEGVVQLLLAREDIDSNLQDIHGQTALSWAAEKGHYRIVRMLLGQGSNPNIEDNAGRTPLTWASEYGHVNAVRALLEYHKLDNIDVNARDHGGRTALWWAAENGHGAVVNELLEAGANMELEPPHLDGWDEPGTPLYRAGAKEHIEVVRLLLDRGANGLVLYSRHTPTIREIVHLLGRTALFFAFLLQSGADPNSATWGGHTLLLLSNGADVNTTDDHGLSPLHAAAETAKVEMVELLFNHGADINAQTHLGLTPLHMSVSSGRAGLTLRCRNGKTALHYAAQGKIILMSILLKQGADINVRDAVAGVVAIQDSNGQTPVQAARQARKDAVADILQERLATEARNAR